MIGAGSPTSSRSRSSSGDPLHLRAARGLPGRGAHPDARASTRRLGRVLRPGEGDAARALRHVLGRRARAAVDLRARHHALHQRVDHPRSCSRWSIPHLEQLAKEGEAGPQEDHPVHALRDGRARPRPGLRDRRSASRACTAPGGAAIVLRPGLGVPADDDHHADLRHGLHHVARRADHRARHRQRHLADHLRRHRRAACPMAIANTFALLPHRRTSRSS